MFITRHTIFPNPLVATTPPPISDNVLTEGIMQLVAFPENQVSGLPQPPPLNSDLLKSTSRVQSLAVSSTVQTKLALGPWAHWGVCAPT